MGGILTAGDLKAAIMSAASVQEFRTLGDRIISPPPESTKEESPNAEAKSETPQASDKPNGIEVSEIDYSTGETARLEKLRKSREELLHRKEMLAARSTFVGLLRQRAKGVVEKLKANDPKGGWKDICGFDSRLAWSDEEFDEWRLSDTGKKALVEGTVEALAASYPTNIDGDGDTAMDNEEDEMAFWTRGICTKKRCERHKQWIKVQQQDIMFEENTADQELSKNESEVRSVAEKAVLRQWAEKENMPSEAQ
jgi:COMPASS component SPP1